MDTARRLTVEIDVGSEPITGRIQDELGSRPFEGWLQLALALEEAAIPEEEPTAE